MLLKNAKILVIDDDPDVLVALRILLRPRVSEVHTERNPNAVRDLLSKKNYDCILLDMNFTSSVNTGNEGLFWLNKIKAVSPALDVILITAYADIDLAIRSLKKGASDFLVKPWKNDKILQSLENLLTHKNRKKQSVSVGASSEKIIGDSEAMRDVFVKLHKVAPTEANILILGENGTGKDLIAKAIHENSLRKDKPFVKVDVGALTSSLFESELFGYKKGAFTGAQEDRKGRFETAQGGTLFLDEIGNISLRQQARLLTVLQNRYITPLGSSENIPVDIRLICATNLRLNALGDEQKFRKDLIYRINTVDIVVPPLRERGDDREKLASYFARMYGEKYGKGPFQFAESFKRKLVSHPFPGNVRELQYAIERAVIMAEDHLLQADDLQFSPIENQHAPQLPEEENLDAVEKKTILRVIDKNKGNISQSAKDLGITRAALYRRLNKYDL